jgi:arabinofuranosyltransferase
MSGRQAGAALAIASALVLALVASAGWIGDDAFITLRVIDNAWHGYGLRWNVVERVQVYTHPLWMLLLGAVYGVSREPFWTTVVASLAATGALLHVVTTRIARTVTGAALALALLASSKAFVEFSTSGLENPLSHLLLALLALSAWPPSPAPWRLSGLAALVALCRFDLLAVIAPLWLSGASRSLAGEPATGRRRVGVALVAGWWPLAAWLAFAVVYYGTPIPNTALAKLPSNVPRTDLAAQGLLYLRDSFRSDPVTLLAIAAAAAHALRTAGARSTGIALGLGLAVVVAVGGDFMSGRFLTPAFVLAVCHVARHVTLPAPASAVAAVAALLLGLAMPESPLRVWRLAPREQRVVTHGHGILDERAFYASFTSVWAVLRDHGPEQHPWARGARDAQLAPRIMVFEAVGLLSFFAGPGGHILDPLALTDPVASRLPALPGWRIGHFRREFPEGYEAAVQACLAAVFPANAIAPPAGPCPPSPPSTFPLPSMAALYEHVVLLSQAPITDARRPAAIWREITRVAGTR